MAIFDSILNSISNFLSGTKNQTPQGYAREFQNPVNNDVNQIGRFLDFVQNREDIKYLQQQANEAQNWLNPPKLVEQLTRQEQVRRGLISQQEDYASKFPISNAVIARKYYSGGGTEYVPFYADALKRAGSKAPDSFGGLDSNWLSDIIIQNRQKAAYDTALKKEQTSNISQYLAEIQQKLGLLSTNNLSNPLESL